MKNNNYSLGELHSIIEGYSLLKIGPPDNYVNLTKEFEYETKIDITSTDQVSLVLSKLSLFSFTGYEYRVEYHLLRSWKLRGTCAEISVKGEPMSWYKIKYDSTVLYSSKRAIPIIQRKSKKYKQNDSSYNKIKTCQEDLIVIGEYVKHCYNFFFEFGDSLFSLSFSLASNNSGFKHNQMEIEYETSLSSANLTTDSVLECFDDLFAHSLEDMPTNAVSKADVLRLLTRP